MKRNSVVLWLLPLGLIHMSPAVAQVAPANRPSIFFTDVTAGPVSGGPGGLGAPISLFGKGFGQTRGSSKVTIGGVEVARYLTWGEQNASNGLLDMIVVQPGPGVPSGDIQVTVGGIVSTGSAQFLRNDGKIYLLSPSGSDSADCSDAAPCQTLLGILGSKARAGDMVLLRGGAYSEGEIWIRDTLGMSGRLGQPIVIKNYPNEQPVFINAARSIAVDASYLTFSGIHLRNGKSIGVSEHLENANATPKGVSIINSSVVGPIAYEGIGLHGDNHLLAGNVVQVKGSSQGTQGHCFYISYGSGGRILYNIAEGAPGYGLHVFDQVRQRQDFRRVISNLLVEGNVLKGSPERSGMIVVMDDGGDWGTYGNYLENITIRNNIFLQNNHHGLVIGGIVRGARVYNNTFYENGRQGIYIGEQPTVRDVEIKNNLIYQTDGNGSCRSNCSWYQMAHIQDALGDPARVRIDTNGYFPGPPILYKGTGSNVSPIQDPRPVTGPLNFQKTAVLDFQILSLSAPIDAGLALADVSRDFNGGLRPQGSKTDIGAFEFGSGPATNGTLGSNLPGDTTPIDPPPTGTTCKDGPITAPCSCGGAIRSDNFCCKGQWFSYDACKTTPGDPTGKPCANGPITTPCICGGALRSDNYCCNGEWFSYDACSQQALVSPLLRMPQCEAAAPRF